jgi:hypothetical protein
MPSPSPRGTGLAATPTGSRASTPRVSVALTLVHRQPKDIAISGNYAYISAYAEGLKITNISDPANPTLGRQLRPQQVRRTTPLSLATMPMCPVTWLGVEIVNISNLASPTLVATIPVGGSGKSAQQTEVVGSLAYIANGVGGLAIFNISNPRKSHARGPEQLWFFLCHWPGRQRQLRLPGRWWPARGGYQQSGQPHLSGQDRHRSRPCCAQWQLRVCHPPWQHNAQNF